MIKKLTLTLVAFLAVVIGFLTIAPSEMSFDDAGYNSKNALEHLQVIAARGGAAVYSQRLERLCRREKRA